MTKDTADIDDVVQKDMAKYIKSSPFRFAWMSSLVAAVIFPFLSALKASALGDSGSALSYLERVNEDFLKNALTFGFVFFVIQFSWGQFLHRRAKKDEASLVINAKKISCHQNFSSNSRSNQQALASGSFSACSLA